MLGLKANELVQLAVKQIDWTYLDVVYKGKHICCV